MFSPMKTIGATFFLGWLYPSYNWFLEGEILDIEDGIGIITIPISIILIIYEINACSFLSRESRPLLEINGGRVKFFEMGVSFEWNEIKKEKLTSEYDGEG